MHKYKDHTLADAQKGEMYEKLRQLLLLLLDVLLVKAKHFLVHESSNEFASNVFVMFGRMMLGP